MQHFREIMFTDTVAEKQAERGSSETYARMTDRPAPEGLRPGENLFIQSRDSFYLGFVSEAGWPSIQHRGGPRGFMKVLDPKTIGFADYRGNRQYVLLGNTSAEDRVSLFLMDYPRKARLKLLGHARFAEAADNPDLAAQLTVDGQGWVERLVTIRIAAFDWTCPQFITPRLATDQIAATAGPEMDRLQARIDALAAESAALKAGT